METVKPPDGNGGNTVVESRSFLKRLRDKTNLDMATSFVILKAAVPQTIAIAMYQARAVSDMYTTLGYLMAIASVLGFAPLPRAVFIQAIIISTLAICIGSSVGLFALWTAIQAREHTSQPSSIPQVYNSSDSAVCAIWLFFQMYLVNALKSARPRLQIPVTLYSVFAVVLMVYGPQFPDMSIAVSFVKRLLETFLTGFGLTAGVSLFLFPVTQRSIVFKELSEYLQNLRGVMKAQLSYTSSLEKGNMAPNLDERSSGPGKVSLEVKKPGHTHRSTYTPQAAALKAATETLKSLHAKLSADLTFAKREMAYGKLSPDDLSQIFKLLRGILIPLIGMSSLIEIFDRVASVEGWEAQDRQIDETKQYNSSEWQNVMGLLHAPLAELVSAIDIALEHILLRLELSKPSKRDAKHIDEESKGGIPQPNTKEFASWFESKIDEFYNGRKITLRNWCEQKGLGLPEDVNWAGESEGFNPSQPSRNQRQLFIVLYIEYLLYSVGRATFDLVSFADLKVTDSTLKRNRMIMPGYRRLKKWISSIFSGDDDDANTNSFGVSLDGFQDVHLGQAFKDRKDPEHLPPGNTWEKMGDCIRVIPRLLRSDHSMFGFRVACATLSIGIVDYLRDSSLFFVQQRLVWSLVMVSISMTRTSGQSLFNFLLRIFGTVCATVASYLVYYIPDGHTAGIIVFLYVWEALCFYIIITKPRFALVGVIAAITVILIVGYELQVRTIGVAAAAASGQHPYGINVLAPFRLACVVGGLAVAWFWTIFPFPVTEHSELRKDIGTTLYLLANFYAIVHETLRARMRGDEGDLRQDGSPGARLDRAKHKVLWKSLLLIDRLKTNSRFSKWEVAVGGKFPREMYDMLINCTESVLSFSALISYSSRTFSSDEKSTTAWQNDFQHLHRHAGATSHEITSRLCLLSSAMSNGTPLPPYLKKMESYGLAESLGAIDTDLLSVNHIAEPGYAAFAVIQIAGGSIISDLNELTDTVKELVGELDFSFHVLGASSSATPVSSAQHSISKGKVT